jgi:hypothetical protein
LALAAPEIIISYRSGLYSGSRCQAEALVETRRDRDTTVLPFEPQRIARLLARQVEGILVVLHDLCELFALKGRAQPSLPLVTED